MDSIKSRSESPSSKSKGFSESHFQSMLSDISENEDSLMEAVKSKKKRLRHKHKHGTHGKERKSSDRSVSESIKDQILISINGGNRDGIYKEEKTKKKRLRHKHKYEVYENEDDKYGKNGNELTREQFLLSKKTENGNDENSKKNDQDVASNDENMNKQEVEEIFIIEENDTINIDCEEMEEKKENNINGKNQNGDNFENIGATTSTHYVESGIVEESNDSKIIETKNNVIKAASTENIVSSGFGIFAESSEGKKNTEIIDSDIPLNGNEVRKEYTPIEEGSESCLNGSDDGSHYEEAHTTKTDNKQESSDSKEDGFFSNKFSNFLGKWNATPTIHEEEKDNEISPPKKEPELQISNTDAFVPPYFIKVSGRRGIKGGMNSSFMSLSSDIDEVKTPKNISDLNDSFRVRTNPTKLNSSQLKENTTLRKFKGKRCLNADDEPEDENDEDYMAATKRRKVDTKPHQSGLWSSLLWSPFQKKPGEDANSSKLPNSESKLSRFLSPFWFWKKTTEGQKEK